MIIERTRLITREHKPQTYYFYIFDMSMSKVKFWYNKESFDRVRYEKWGRDNCWTYKYMNNIIIDNKIQLFMSGWSYMRFCKENYTDIKSGKYGIKLHTHYDNHPSFPTFDFTLCDISLVNFDDKEELIKKYKPDLKKQTEQFKQDMGSKTFEIYNPIIDDFEEKSMSEVYKEDKIILRSKKMKSIIDV